MGGFVQLGKHWVDSYSVEVVKDGYLPDTSELTMSSGDIVLVAIDPKLVVQMLVIARAENEGTE